MSETERIDVDPGRAALIIQDLQNDVMVEGGATGGGSGAAGAWAKARPAASVAAVTPTAPTSVRRDIVAPLLASNSSDELMSVTPYGFIAGCDS